MNIVKYPGGKERELGLIRSLLPKKIKNYYEPFVGGGSVFLDVNAEKHFINDLSRDLINLYSCVQKQDVLFYQTLNGINNSWKRFDTFAAQDAASDDGLYAVYIGYRDGHITEPEMERLVTAFIDRQKEALLDLVYPKDSDGGAAFICELKRIIPGKFKRMKVLEFSKKHISDEDVKENILGCFKSAYYMYIRRLYNEPKGFDAGHQAMFYLFMRDMCYSSMFRFNAKGEFNVPYGGISYNGKNYDATIQKYKNPDFLKKMENTNISCIDYMAFLLKYNPGEGDFIFCDPPYDSEFSTYDKNTFDQDEQWRLAMYLIHECKANFMADIKYTDYVASLYPEGYICANGNPLKIVFFDKTYSVSFMDRNDRKSEHMIITNY